MALADRPAVQRLIEQAEDRLGVAFRAPARVRELEMRETEYMAFANDVESLGLYSMGYFTGRPQEMLPERRRRLAQRSRRALLEDPLAGAEAQILGDFGFGKGVPKPIAKDEKVQEVIDRAWSDPNNFEKLTGYIAQRKLSNELITSAELFVTLYRGGGRVRVGRRDPDTIVDVVPDPEDENRPLWYLEQVRRFEWDFENDAAKVSDITMQGGKPKVRYWPHWRNVDDAQEERALGVSDDEQPLEMPPRDKRANGVMYHLPINQTGQQLRGNPPWARTLRFFTAMNVLTESHVTMAQAASTFIARRVMRATPRQLSQAVNKVISQASELGAGRAGWGGGTSDYRIEGYGGGQEYPATGQEPATRPFTQGGAPPPMPPGSWWNENESSRLEALNLNSGAAQMAQTAQIVRAPIAANAQFGQHYLGDTSDANLATASTLELPATMRITGWQQYFEELYRWFTDRAIEAAVQAGLLGDKAPADGEPRTPLNALRIQEAEDIQQLEKRTGKDLSYEFVMPFPGRRQLPDVGTFVQTLCTAMDPNGVSKPMRRVLLKFAYEQIGIDDVAGAVLEAIPDKDVPGGIGSSDFMGSQPPPPGGAPGAPGAPGSNGSTPPDGQQPYGARSQATPPEKAAPAAEGAIPENAKAGVDQFTQGMGELFAQVVTSSALAATKRVAANGASQ